MQNPAPIILHIECAIGTCSVAVSEGTKLLAEIIELEKNRAGERIHDMVHEVLEKAMLKISSIQAVALSGGPGSYTGLRIGASAAKGICYGLQIPLLHVETLQIMQQAVSNRLLVDAQNFVAMIDARRMDVFAAVMDKKANYLQEPRPLTLEDNSFNEYIQQSETAFFGDGVDKFKPVLAKGSAQIIQLEHVIASDMILIALEIYRKKMYADTAYYEPKYYKAAFLAKN